MEIIIDVSIAQKNYTCDLTKKFIKKNDKLKVAWVEPYGKSFIFKKNISKRRIKNYVLCQIRY